MTTEIGDAPDKYRRKLMEEDDLDLGHEDLIDILNGRPVRRRMPLKENPQISYQEPGGDGDGDDDNGPGGDGDPGIEIGITADDIIAVEKNWGIKFTRPGKKDKVKLEFMVGQRGYQENQEATLEAMLERQIISGDFKRHGFKIDVREEDVRYDIAEEKYVPEESAHFIVIRDISPSMLPNEPLSFKIALYIAIGLREMYRDRLTMVYALHAIGAEEVSQREFFTKGDTGGGTAYLSSFQLVSAMLDGTPYITRLNYPRRIDSESEDVYVLHITDGETSGDDIDRSLQEFGRVLPRISGFKLLQIEGESTAYMDKLKEIGSPKIKAIQIPNEDDIDTVKKAVLELFGD